jgi:tetratricopeptide (TPR) repeat protein
MTLRPKTTRRLAVLAVIAAMIVGGGSAVVSMRLRRFESRRQATRAAAFDAYRHGDYPAALNSFRRYFGSLGGDASAANADAPAVFAYAVSRARVPGPDLGYLVTAKSIFGRYLELVPNDPAAEHELLSIYRRLGYDSQTAPLADALLRQDPSDVHALSAKLRIQGASGHLDEALALSQQVNALTPMDLQSQITTLTLMKSAGQPDQAIVDRADSLLAAHPREGKFVVLRGIAASLAGDNADAARYLRQAAAMPAPGDQSVVLTLAGAFDRLGLHDDATALMERALRANPPADSALLCAALLRQWERGGGDQLLRRLAAIGSTTLPAAVAAPAPPPADSTLLALKALALFTRGQNGDATAATAIVADLTHRRADLAAAAWADLLRARFSTPPLPPPADAQLCRAASALQPSNPIARYFLGLCEQEVGEDERAIAAWHEAAELAPAWASPHLQAGRMLLASGRAPAAALDADAALASAAAGLPDALDAAALSVAVAARQLSPAATPADIRPVLDRAAQVQSQSPGEPLTLPIQIDLLARSGERAQAAALASRAAARTPAVSAAALAGVARVVTSDQLPAADAVADAILRQRPETASEGLEGSLALAELGRSDAGAHRLEAEALAHPTSPRWRLALLQYRQTQSAAATTLELNDSNSWASLGDGCPGDPTVQRAVLAAPVAWTDRALIIRTIERLHRLTGEQGIGWRLAQARLQLSVPAQSASAAADAAAAAAASMAEAARFAPALAEPRILWALALEKLGDIPGAIARLREADALSPDDPAVTVPLARLLALQSQTSAAATTRPTPADRESASINLSH